MKYPLLGPCCRVSASNWTTRLERDPMTRVYKVRRPGSSLDVIMRAVSETETTLMVKRRLKGACVGGLVASLPDLKPTAAVSVQNRTSSASTDEAVKHSAIMPKPCRIAIFTVTPVRTVHRMAFLRTVNEAMRAVKPWLKLASNWSPQPP